MALEPISFAAGSPERAIVNAVENGKTIVAIAGAGHRPFSRHGRGRHDLGIQ